MEILSLQPGIRNLPAVETISVLSTGPPKLGMF